MSRDSKKTLDLNNIPDLKEDLDLSKINVTGSVPAKDHVEILGFLQNDKDDGAIRLRDRYGTWVINSDDIESLEGWSGADVKLDGKPVRARVRARSNVQRIRDVTMLPTDQPLTFPDNEKPPTVVGTEDLHRAGIDKLGITPFDPLRAPGIGPSSSTTASCWGTGDWGMDCSPDDSGF